MKDVMIDIETLGTEPGSLILSVGAVRFGPDGVAIERFYRVLDRVDQEDRNFLIDPETVAWWKSQAQPVSRVLEHAIMPGVFTPGDGALVGLAAFVDGAERVWAKPAHFDLVLLHAAYRKYGLATPWQHRQAACFRTALKLYGDPGIAGDEASKHDALADAEYQARQAVALFNARGWPT